MKKRIYVSRFGGPKNKQNGDLFFRIPGNQSLGAPPWEQATARVGGDMWRSEGGVGWDTTGDNRDLAFRREGGGR
jgi:hypothetical protein